MAGVDCVYDPSARRRFDADHLPQPTIRRRRSPRRDAALAAGAIEGRMRARGRREASAWGQQKARPVWATAGRNSQDVKFIAYRTGAVKNKKRTFFQRAAV
ncbi:MAG: hypothetical protein KGI43_09910, partial [Alphaproteobacteria bacterium]|nr:hypothetical protein [Alphaproteobacteria bacterium]